MDGKKIKKFQYIRYNFESSIDINTNLVLSIKLVFWIQAVCATMT